MTTEDRFETSDASTLKVAIGAWLFVPFLIAVAGGLWLSFHSSFDESRLQQTRITEATFPSPRLRPDSGPWQTPDPAESAAIDETLNAVAKKNQIHLHFAPSERSQAPQ